MATATKPPLRPKLSPKDEACHTLVRLLMRAYYEKEHVAVLDCLLDLQVKQANKVTESDLASELHLSPKLIREVLHRLRADQIVRGIQKADATSLAAKGVEELTSKGKRKSYQPRAPAVVFLWSVDFEQLVNVVKYRHWDIFEKLNKKTDRADVSYVCPNAACPNHAPSRKRSVMDLLLDQRGSGSGGAFDGVFRCELCGVKNPVTGVQTATALVLFTHQEAASSSSSAAAAASSSSSATGAGAAAAPGAAPSEVLKNKFNRQLGVILEQLMRVDRMLQEDLVLKKEQVAAGIMPSAAAIELMQQKASGGIDFSQANTVAANVAAAAAAAAAAAGGAGGTAAAAAQAAANASFEDMISVSLADGTAVPALRGAGAKPESLSSSSSASAIPWDRNAPPLNLAKMEEEKRAQEAARSTHALAEKQRLAEMEARRFQVEYEAQLAKMQQQHQQHAAAASSSAAAAAAASAAPHDMQLDGVGSSEQTVLVQGRPVALWSISQEEIDQMTEAEYDAYEALAGGQEEF